VGGRGSGPLKQCARCQRQSCPGAPIQLYHLVIFLLCLQAAEHKATADRNAREVASLAAELAALKVRMQGIGASIGMTRHPVALMCDVRSHHIKQSTG
jgi:hypothetical protein